MNGGEDDAMKGGNGREEQCTGQTGIPHPFFLARKDAGRDQDVVSLQS